MSWVLKYLQPAARLNSSETPKLTAAVKRNSSAHPEFPDTRGLCKPGSLFKDQHRKQSGEKRPGLRGSLRGAPILVLSAAFLDLMRKAEAIVTMES